MIHKLKNTFNDSDRKEILTKGFSFLLFRIVGFIAGYVFTYLIAIKYGAKVNGLVTLSFTLILCASILGRLGIDINLIRFFSKAENKNRPRLFLLVLIISFLFSSFLSVLLYLLKDVICVRIFNKPQLIPYVQWICTTIPLWSVILVCGGLFRAFKKNSHFAFFNSSGRFILSVIVFGLLITFYDDLNDLLAIKSHFVAIFILALIAIILTFKQFKGSDYNSRTIKKGALNIFLKESFPMMISEATLLFLIMIDTIILGIFETDSTIGIYNVAYKIAVVTIFSLQALNSILAPKIAEQYHSGNLSGCQKMITFSTNLNFVITIVILTGIVLFHNIILNFFGEEFVSGQSILLILCVGQLINSISGSVGVILQMTGNQKKYQNIILLALIINLTLNLILTPKYGATGTACATVISLIFWNITSATYIKLKIGLISYFNFKVSKK